MKKQITISAVKKCLEEGMSREEIAKYFEISLKELREHFKHPKLKGLKKKRKKEFTSILVDDTEEATFVPNSKKEEIKKLKFDANTFGIDNTEILTKEEAESTTASFL